LFGFFSFGVFFVDCCVKSGAYGLVCQKIDEGFAAWVTAIGGYYVVEAYGSVFSVNLSLGW